ncbi:hypothetical protein SERLADRAFT_345177, partial [Serpula lacrymans var. lacrymans S7.9]
VTTSTHKVQYIMACKALKEVVWLCSLLSAISRTQKVPLPLLCDNNGTITLSDNLSFHA